MSEQTIEDRRCLSVDELITALITGQPNSDATKVERAIWYERKAVTLWEIAAVVDQDGLERAAHFARMAEQTAAILRAAVIDDARNEALRQAYARRTEVQA